MVQRQVTFVEAIKMALQQNYCNFTGRSSRSEYWWFMLFSFIVSAVINMIFGRHGMWIGYIVGLAFLLPTLGLSWRRMHDIGKSGAWWFINFIPLVGTILWIVWCCKESEPHPNQYGPEPNMA